MTLTFDIVLQIGCTASTRNIWCPDPDSILIHSDAWKKLRQVLCATLIPLREINVESLNVLFNYHHNFPIQSHFASPSCHNGYTKHFFTSFPFIRSCPITALLSLQSQVEPSVSPRNALQISLAAELSSRRCFHAGHVRDRFFFFRLMVRMEVT